MYRGGIEMPYMRYTIVCFFGNIFYTLLHPDTFVGDVDIREKRDDKYSDACPLF
jgi:hypothetical protein